MSPAELRRIADSLDDCADRCEALAARCRNLAGKVRDSETDSLTGKQKTGMFRDRLFQDSRNKAVKCEKWGACASNRQPLTGWNT